MFMVSIGTTFKSTEVIPVAGRYQCVVCKLVVDVPAHVVAMGKTFFACPICHAGEEGGAKGPHEEVWEYLG